MSLESRFFIFLVMVGLFSGCVTFTNLSEIKKPVGEMQVPSGICVKYRNISEKSVKQIDQYLKSRGQSIVHDGVDCYDVVFYEIEQPWTSSFSGPIANGNSKGFGEVILRQFWLLAHLLSLTTIPYIDHNEYKIRVDLAKGGNVEKFKLYTYSATQYSWFLVPLVSEVYSSRYKHSEKVGPLNDREYLTYYSLSQAMEDLK